MKEPHSIGPGRIIRRKKDGSLEYLRDDLTIEEPLEIRIDGKALATTMRTPGHDEELAAGFLMSEAIVRNRSAIVKISRDGDNRVMIDLVSVAKLKLSSAQRFGTISSSCGLCGKTSIDEIRQKFPAIESGNVRIDIDTLLSLPEKLRKAQSDFSRTGGIHDPPPEKRKLLCRCIRFSIRRARSRANRAKTWPARSRPCHGRPAI